MWASVLPLALAAAGAVAVVRPGYLRSTHPGPQVLQRIGLFVLTAPLFLLLFIGVSAIENLFSSPSIAPVPSSDLASKALFHVSLYLLLPLAGLLLVLGPNGSLRAATRSLFGGEPDRGRVLAGLASAGTLSLTLTGLLWLGWTVLPSEGAGGLFAADGARVFFSNTTPAVALMLAGAAAVAEESLFRGILLTHLRRTTGLHAAVAIQALAFGLIHAGYGSVAHVAAATAFGAMMGYLVTRHGLVPAMVVHFLVNVVILASWSASGAVLVPVIALSLFALGVIALVHHAGGRTERAPASAG